jgi:hypothetical protein
MQCTCKAWSGLRKSAPTPASERMRIRFHTVQHQTTYNPSNHNSLRPATHLHTHPHQNHHTQHIPKCPSSSATPAPSPLPPRRSQQQKPRSRWFPTCSTSKSSERFLTSITKRASAHLQGQQKDLTTFLSLLNRLVDTCTKKCIPPQYREADLNKGESVCLDRCVSKFFEVNVKVSEKMQGEAQAKQGGGFA